MPEPQAQTPNTDPTIQDLIREEATKAGVPPSFALAVGEQESDFNPTAIGPRLPSGEQAVGTFQLLPSTAKRLGVDPTNPRENIRGGVAYLRELYDQHNGNREQILKAYGGVRTNTTYVPEVLARIPKFAAQDQGGAMNFAVVNGRRVPVEVGTPPPAAATAPVWRLASAKGGLGVVPTLVEEAKAGAARQD